MSLFAAESVLRMTEHACKSSCDVEGDANWLSALEKRLKTREITFSGEQIREAGQVLVISIYNTQSHALTCSKSKGSSNTVA